MAFFERLFGSDEKQKRRHLDDTLAADPIAARDEGESVPGSHLHADFHHVPLGLGGWTEIVRPHIERLCERSNRVRSDVARLTSLDARDGRNIDLWLGGITQLNLRPAFLSTGFREHLSVQHRHHNPPKVVFALSDSNIGVILALSMRN